MANFWSRRTNLAGKSAIVIGGGGGIGRAVSFAVAGAGVRLLLCDLDSTAMASTIAEGTTNGGSAAGFAVYAGAARRNAGQTLWARGMEA